MRITHGAFLIERTIPLNAKIIIGLSYADILKHYIDLATILTETRTIVSIQLYAIRTKGTGLIFVYPNEGTYAPTLTQYSYDLFSCVLAANTNRLQVAFNVASDVFDVYCMSYVVKAIAV